MRREGGVIEPLLSVAGAGLLDDTSTVSPSPSDAPAVTVTSSLIERAPKSATWKQEYVDVILYSCLIEYDR